MFYTGYVQDRSFYHHYHNVCIKCRSLNTELSDCMFSYYGIFTTFSS